MAGGEGFFRSKKGFTIVQNELVKDTEISLKAKGLYLVIQSYITMPDKKWTKDNFLQLTKEGSKAFNTAWDELKNKGYLKVHCMSESGFWHIEYELLDTPLAGAHTFYYNSAGELTSDNLKRAEKKAEKPVLEELPIEEELVEEKVDEEENSSKNTANPREMRYPPFGSNGKVEGYRYPPFGSNGNGSNGNGYNAKGGNIKIKDFNIKLKTLNTLNTSINPSKDNNNIKQDEKPMDGMENQKPVDSVVTYTALIRKNIDYDTVNDSLSLNEKELFEEIYALICDVVCVPRKSIRVGKEDYPYELVKSQYLKLNLFHIRYIMEQMSKTSSKICNIRAYLITALYNAPSTINYYYQQEMQHNVSNQPMDIMSISDKGEGG